jgi:hypothetical protein
MRCRDSAIFLRAALVALLMFLAPSVVFAAPDADRSAARHFADGQKAFTAGDYAHAGDEFEAAYRDKPHHAPLWNAARSWQRAGEDVRAANLYARYLREAPADAPDRDQATAALRALTSRMGRIEAHAAGVEKLRLDGKPVEAPVVYVAAGEHVAEADDKGRPVRKVVRVTAGELVSVTLAPEARRDPVVVGPPPPPVVAPPPAQARKPLSPIVPIVGGALTVAAGAFAIVSGLDTTSKRDAFLDDRTQPRLDDAFSSQTRTNVLIGTTAGLGVITGVIALFFTDWSGGSTSERSASAGTR